MNELIDKVWENISKWPSIPPTSLMAFFIVIILLLPHIRKLWQSPKIEELAHEPVHEVHQTSPVRIDPWIIQRMVQMESNQQDMMHVLIDRDGVSRLETIKGRLDLLSQQMADLNTLLRKRSGRSKKLG